MSKRHRRSNHPFVQLHHWFLNSTAWSTLSTNARCVYVAVKQRYNGQNNGTISFSSREAGAAIGRSHHAGARAMTELVDRGFLLVTEDSNFDRKHKLARQYLLTEVSDDRPGFSKVPLKLFMRGTGYAGPAGKKQKSVALVNSTVSSVRALTCKSMGENVSSRVRATVEAPACEHQSHDRDTSRSEPLHPSTHRAHGGRGGPVDSLIDLQAARRAAVAF